MPSKGCRLFRLLSRLSKEGYIHASITGRVKNPIVLLEFDDRKLHREFMIYWIIHRLNLFKKRINLYIITPMNEENAEIFREKSIFVSRFDHRFVSVSYFMSQAVGIPYYKNKKRYDDAIRDVRHQLFKMIIWMLKEIENNY